MLAGPGWEGRAGCLPIVLQNHTSGSSGAPHMLMQRVCVGLLGNAETGEEGTAAVVSLAASIPGSLSKPPAVAPSANQGDDAPEWGVAPHS